MKPYLSYIDSGVEWIGEIPKGWETTKVKHETVVVSDGTHFTPTYTDSGIPFLRVTDIQNESIDQNKIKYISEIEHLELIKRCKPKRGDLLLSKNGTIGLTKVVNWDWEFSIFVSLCLIRFKKSFSPYLFSYFFESDIVNQQLVESSKQSTVTNLHLDKIKELILIKPPLQEQQQISNYLDQKTQQIDELIEKTQQKIKLLKEKRTSLINHCVTKGLNPNVEMKDSGVEWIGEIPKGWGFVMVGHYSTVVRGGSPRPSGDSRYFNGNYINWITVKDITSKTGKFVLKTDSMLTEEGMKQSRVLEPETLVLTNSGVTLGIPGILKIKGCINDGSVGFLNLSDKVERDFLYYFWTTQTERLLEQQSGYGQPNLNIEIVSGIKFPLPPISEQQQIVTHLDKETKKIDTLVEKENKRIDLLKEYRQSLISEVVTGKIDVRDEVLQ